jgi:hypothetical protein
MGNDKAVSSSSSSSGIGFVGLLTIVFIVLRLIPHGDGHVIDWSWWWVLSPLWISAIGGVLVVGAIVVAAMVKAVKS